MPALNKIESDILRRKSQAQDDIRREYLKALAAHTGRDTILYASSFSSSKAAGIPGALLSVTLEDVQGFMASLHGLTGNKLDRILHSPGGSLEAAEQIVTYLRSKYTEIRAIVPQNAMSAATMLACACDTIVMAKPSARSILR
jgi:ClpP class serine protease